VCLFHDLARRPEQLIPLLTGETFRRFHSEAEPIANSA
jgi:hypothetical protein